MQKCGITKRMKIYLATELKSTECYDLTNKEVKIAVMKKFNKLQLRSQFNILRNKINEQKFFRKR